MHASEQLPIARFSSPDEVRGIYLVPSEQGGAHLLHYSRGRLTRLAFGEDAVCHRLSLDGQALAQLAARLGWGDDIPCALARFFERDETLLVDLLDICDRAGIPYGFCSVGSSMGTMVRRRGSVGERPAGIPG